MPVQTNASLFVIIGGKIKKNAIALNGWFTLVVQIARNITGPNKTRSFFSTL